MTILQKAATPLLNTLDRKYWDSISFIISQRIRSNIASPIYFNVGKELTFIEYPKVLEMPLVTQKELFDFLFDGKINECDKQYLPYSSAFIILNPNRKIVGCALYIVKTRKNKLPIEHSTIVSNTSSNKTYFNVENDLGVFNSETGIYNSVEIYGLKVDPPKSEKRSMRMIGHMLFKGCVAKSLQDDVQYMYITCSNSSKQLENMYKDKLAFDDLGYNVSYDNGKSEWKALRRDCVYCDNELASHNFKHFYLQTFFREGLKKKSFSKKHIVKPLFLAFLQITNHLMKFIFTQIKKFFFSEKTETFISMDATRKLLDT